MSWTYEPALLNEPARGPLMQVRLMIGDTNSADQQMQDEEIAYLLSITAGPGPAAYQACLLLAAKYARKADKQVGDLRIAYSAISKRYTDLAQQVVGTRSLNQIPTAGGVYVSEQEAYEGNSGLRHNSIKRGMHDYVTPSTSPNTKSN